MDRQHLQPVDRLHEGFTGMSALLRGIVFQASRLGSMGLRQTAAAHGKGFMETAN
jgi:hypothetical protein